MHLLILAGYTLAMLAVAITAVHKREYITTTEA
jgi:hypothetical protein